MSEIKKFSRMDDSLLQYGSGANPNATTMQMMQGYMKQNGDTVGDLVDALLWQPTMSIKEGQLVHTANLPVGYVAIAQCDGLTGETEPEWEEEYKEYSDGTVVWNIEKRVTVSDLPVAATYEEAEAGQNEDKYVSPKVIKQLLQTGNDTYGVAPNPVTHRHIKKSGNRVSLSWADPEDIIIDGSVLSEWLSTTIVRKQGSYPESIDDGVIIATNTSRNMFRDSWLEEELEEPENWYYRAFPKSKGGLLNNSELNRFDFWHFAIYIDETDSIEATAVHKVPGFDNYFYKPIKMKFTGNVETNTCDYGDWEDAPFMPKPCMLRSNGEVDYYLNPNDLTLKENGFASDVSNTAYDGNAMMEWSAVFTKVERKDKKFYVYYCSEKYDDDYECYSLKHNGGYYEHFYLPIFEGVVINSKLRSINTNGRPTASTTAPNEMLYARANGAGWYPTTWADEDLMRLLGFLVMGRLNCEIAIGTSPGNSTSALTHNVGTGVQKGMFFGHSANSARCNKYFGMENWWGHRWRRPVGLMLKSGSLEIMVKLTRDTSDGSTVTDYNNTGDGYIATGVFVPSMSSSYISKMAADPRCATAPIEATGASATTKYCDGGWSANGVTQLILGGGVASPGVSGLFAFAANYAPGSAYWTFGASLSYRKAS